MTAKPIRTFPGVYNYQPSERIAPWTSQPEIQRKLLAKLAEIERELQRTHGAAHGLKRFVQVAQKGDSPAFERSANELKGWIESLVESMAYIAKMLRSSYGITNFKGFALQAMQKGDLRATNDARLAGVHMHHWQILHDSESYFPKPVDVAPPKSGGSTMMTHDH